MKKILKNHWGAVVLFAFGLFMVFVRSAGSLDGDEAIYAQVAKETLANNSWLTLHWRGEIWLEKPPFFIWLQMINVSLFGYGEVVLRFTSGLFGVLTAVLVYFITYDIFKNKRGAFISGIILFSTPFFINSMRFAMTDTMVTFFITLALFVLYKIIKSDGDSFTKWLKIFAVATGCAIMTKSMVGVIPIFGLTFSIITIKKVRIKILKNKKELFFSILILFLIIAPWHIFMSLKFGREFWREYIGYHVVDRIRENIIVSPYNNYLEAIWNKLGIWPPVFVVLLLGAKKSLMKYKKEIIFFLANAVFIISAFSMAKTIVPHYILPAVPLVAIVIGGIMGEIFKNKQKMVVILSGISLLNFTPFFILQASDYGASNILIPRIIDHFLKNNVNIFYIIIFNMTMMCLFVELWLYKKYTKIIGNTAFALLISMNIFVPFYSDRGVEMKKLGIFIENISKEKQINYIFMTKSEKYRTNTLLFYVPLGIKVERLSSEVGSSPNIYQRNLLQKNREQALCVILDDGKQAKNLGKNIYTFNGGVVKKCNNSVKNKKMNR